MHFAQILSSVVALSASAVARPQDDEPPSTTRVEEPPTQTAEPVFVHYGGQQYQACGISRRGYLLCPSKSYICLDNPEPSSCGQACDALGVCQLWATTQVCGPGNPCANKGRCKRAVWDCPVDKDGNCVGACFPDYWNGKPDAYNFTSVPTGPVGPKLV